jgi:deoxyribose-phosphate aldolase
MPGAITPADVARATELTLVRADVTRQQVRELCVSAVDRGCYGVCVNSSRVADAYNFGADAGLKVISTIGFPFGAMDADAKRYEVDAAVDAGAHELDVVMNVGLLKDGATQAVLRELRDIVEAADDRPVKVLVDLSLVDAKELATACQITLDSGAQFLSVSAPVERVAELVKVMGPKFMVKAFASKMAESTRLLEAGAHRIGQVAG